MPIKHAKAGKTVMLKEISWGQSLKNKLKNMGLKPGVRFNIVSSTQDGPVIINLKGTTLALGYGIQSKIMVEEI